MNNATAAQINYTNAGLAGRAALRAAHERGIYGPGGPLGVYKAAKAAYLASVEVTR